MPPAARYFVFGCLLLFARWAVADQSGGVSAAQRTFFEAKIRPVLVNHCYECHSAASKKIGGGLRLDTAELLRRGGESGPLVNLRQPGESLLLHALRYDGVEMPPDAPLSGAIVQDFATWIEMGAPDVRDQPAPSLTAPAALAQGSHWAFRPIQNPSPPATGDPAWGRDPMDQFVLAGLEARGLAPVPDAPPRTLVRRIYIDLTGLPPTVEQVSAFLDAYRNQGLAAVEALVDALLASPHFGERWGRHWLDVARFAESNGNDGLSRNPTFPHAWRYRDYVIGAWNADVPFDRFVTEQIAGDLLVVADEAERDRLLVATGFLALGAKPAKAMNDNFDMDVVADQIEVVSSGIMGLSVACARCHDHKSDPIPTRDYYAMAGIFTSTETLWGVAAHEGLTAPVTDLHVLKTALREPPPEGFVETVLVNDSTTGKPRPFPKPKWAPGTPLAMGVRDRPAPADCKINLKGESKQTGAAVPRGFLSMFPLASPAPASGRSGRLELAKWLMHPDHPLTARVIVNRLWHHLFGAGLVASPDDFGVYGSPPSHPELLDHLAVRLVHRNHWSLKRTIRDMVLSRTYQMDSLAPEGQLREDPTNQWLGRHSRRRLDAESFRDALLVVSGQLDPTPGPGSIIRHRDILVNLAGNLHAPSRHRSVYLCFLRNSPPPELAAFNLPDFRSVTGARDVNTLPAQALYLANNPFVLEQAGHLAAAEAPSTPEDWGPSIRRVYHRAFLREPTPEELENALRYLRSSSQIPSREDAWRSFCQALLSANEFRYID